MPIPRLTSLRRRVPALFALSPALITVLIVYIGCALWSARLSFTASRALPVDRFVGTRQYETLFSNGRWMTSVENLALMLPVFLLATLAIGTLMAVLLDQRVRAESALRSVFLYPYSVSFVITGLVWQWMLNPSVGIEKMVRGWGFSAFSFDWIIRQERAIWAVIIAAVWHGAGLVMAIMLAALRGVDEEIWKAARVDGIPRWRAYVSIILPMTGGAIATASVLLAVSTVRLYDLVVAMTAGGPGGSTEVPAKFIVDHLFERQNVGLATAAATVMLGTVLAVVVPFIVVRQRAAERGA